MHITGDKIIEIICPIKLKPTPTGIKTQYLNNEKPTQIAQRFICPLCNEPHEWSHKDIIDF